MKRIREGHILAVYLILFFLLATVMLIFQPLSDRTETLLAPPDEVSRYMIPKYIYEHGALPTGLEEEIRIKPYGFSYGLSTTFPYILQGLAMRFTGLFTQSKVALIYTARAVNVVFGLLNAFALWLVARRLFRRRWIRWLFCFSLAFEPEYFFLFTYINTEACCMFSITLIILALLRARDDGFALKTSVLLSLGVSLCALSYYNAYGWILGAILLFLSGWYVRRSEGGPAYRFAPMLRRGLPICGMVLLGIGWWFVRQYIVLDGDFLGMSTRARMTELYGSSEVQLSNSYRAQGYSILWMLLHTGFVRTFLASFVANWGSMSIHAPAPVYVIFPLIWVVGLGGLCLKRTAEEAPADRPMNLVLLLGMVMPFLLQVVYSYNYDFQPQGRYALPGLISLAIFSARGLDRLTRRYPRLRQLPAILTGLTVLCILWMTLGKALPLYLAAGCPGNGLTVR